MTNDRISVLVIEDGIDAAELIERKLNRPRATAQEAAQFAVKRVPTIDAAVEQLERVEFDVILVGSRRNNGTDIQRIARLQKAYPDTILVAITDSPDERMAVAASSVGAMECLHSEQTGFLPTLLELMVGRRRAEDTLARREADFLVLSQHASEITTLLDADANIRYMSPSVEPTLCYAPD